MLKNVKREITKKRCKMGTKKPANTQKKPGQTFLIKSVTKTKTLRKVGMPSNADTYNRGGNPPPQPSNPTCPDCSSLPCAGEGQPRPPILRQEIHQLALVRPGRRLAGGGGHCGAMSSTIVAKCSVRVDLSGTLLLIWHILFVYGSIYRTGGNQEFRARKISHTNTPTRIAIATQWVAVGT